MHPAALAAASRSVIFWAGIATVLLGALAWACRRRRPPPPAAIATTTAAIAASGQHAPDAEAQHPPSALGRLAPRPPGPGAPAAASPSAPCGSTSSSLRRRPACASGVARRGFQHSSMNSANSSVRRSGASRISKNELASIRRPLGSSRASASASENGCTGSRGWPITRAGVSNVSRSDCGGAVRPKNRPWMTAALGAGSWRTQSSTTSPQKGRPRLGTARAPAWTIFITGSPNVSAIISGVKAIAQPSSALSSTGISMIMPRSRSGRDRGHAQRDVGAQRGAADDGVLDVEVVEQADGLRGEQLHPVDAHVARAGGLAVAEQVEGDDAVARARPARGPAGCASAARTAGRAAGPSCADPRRRPCRPGDGRRA